MKTQEFKYKLFDILSDLEFLAADIELSYSFHSHLNGYFDEVPKTDREAIYKFNELAVLSSVQLDRLFAESKQFNELLKRLFELINRG